MRGLPKGAIELELQKHNLSTTQIAMQLSANASASAVQAQASATINAAGVPSLGGPPAAGMPHPSLHPPFVYPYPFGYPGIPPQNVHHPPPSMTGDPSSLSQQPPK
jgi:hypothetical protein